MVYSPNKIQQKKHKKAGGMQPNAYNIFNMLFRISLPTDKEETNEYIHKNQTIYHIFNSSIIQEKSGYPRKPCLPFTRNTATDFNESSIVKDYLNMYSEDIIDYLAIKLF